MRTFFTRFLGALLVLNLLGSTAATAQAVVPETAVRQIWQQIDYVGVDYGGAVAHGQVASASEYAEMREFVGNALTGARGLPPSAGRSQVIAAIEALNQAVERRAEPAEVSQLSRRASELLLAQYPVPVAPRVVPDLQRGAEVYRAQCAACHGATGHADGPLSAKLDPRPVAFSEHERARSRSLLALYQVVTQGVSGTSMASFAALPEADRWAVAFYAGTLSYDAARRDRGEATWKNDAAARAAFPDLAKLTTSSEAVAAETLGEERAQDVTAYLRSDPKVLVANQPSGLALARLQLTKSLAAARAGDSSEATRLALSAYLDGFEPVEPTLGVRNKALLAEVETKMLAYRSALSAGKVEEAAAAAKQLEALITSAEAELSAGAADPLTTFLGALTILLREGVEALLIVVAMIAFLRKADRQEALRYVHGGWVAALAAGGLTWWVATYFVSVSGASREVTEGLSSLFAAVVLLSVGLWMHQKSSAGRWQAYLKAHLSAALTRRSAWALFALAFIAVYREVFETVLFFSALAADGYGSAMVAGLITGSALLALIAFIFLRTSARMPIGKFFAASSVLVAVLAVVLVGKGIAGLQEAGWLSATPIDWLRLPVLGVYPTLQTNLAQILVLLAALAGFGFNALKAREGART
ncbi:cytochrome c/FTR1 family iron permease [Roseateles saccharophilus]|uniref:High-affinity iron transporter n=1 Tax=Roseateles saccharophilus TaxID=304 RepID=A0A4V2VQI1_ROSSA|nr:cytochrome c/FTR1 family iron permease [Roseateles saccharophilus]MDG0833191.1 c-type cytochrome [Roseateles saccharophilus]TCU94659.1 high-affinity iron transporter [Roseateles saccharophilus]